jgi:hypothetical protein
VEYTDALRADSSKTLMLHCLLNDASNCAEDDCQSPGKYQKEDFVRSVISTVMPTPPNYKEIVSINKFERKLPTTINEIHELEIGPNRCSISNMHQ